MKIFTKIMLIIAGVFTAIGVICMVVAFAMGLTTEHLGKMVQDGYFSFDAGDIKLFDYKEGLIIKIDNDNKTDSTETELGNGETSIYNIKESCENIDIEFGAGILNIYYDDVEAIQVIKEANLSELTVNVKNGTLAIGFDGDIEIGMDDIEDRSLTVIIPKEMQFDEVELKIGASQADIKDIVANNISITVGAGQAIVSEISAKQMELEVGAGQAEVTQLFVDKLDVEAGIGEVNIVLNGVQEDYNYHIECGVGDVVVGKTSYGGLGAEQSGTYEGATKEINVECGIGEVVIQFKE